MPHRVHVNPVRLREHSDLLGLDTIRVVGYRAVCTCGDRSPVKKSHTLARLWMHDHVRRFSGPVATHDVSTP